VNLAEFHAKLRDSPDIVAAARFVAGGLANRNLGPLDGAELHARGMAEDDELARRYAALLDHVQSVVEETDLSDTACLASNEIHRSLRVAVALANSGHEQEEEIRAQFTRHAVADVLADFMPDIEDYVQHLTDTALMDELGLESDGDMLVDISAPGIAEVRQHGVVLSDNVMVYLHQFIRRFYSGNFVGLPAMLREFIDDGFSVKARLDPLRSWLHPALYRAIIEEDYWHGPVFGAALLNCTDENQMSTVHWTDDNDYGQYPVKFTIFRTSMMDDCQRQFMIEEYTPPQDPWSGERNRYGFGQNYCIQKFAHFVYDQSLGTITHIDGAVRVFEVDEYAAIFRAALTGNVPESRIGDRHKLFLVEGSLDLNRAQRLLYEFFMYNGHLEEYFGEQNEPV
jgi:hypothetical protein